MHHDSWLTWVGNNNPNRQNLLPEESRLCHGLLSTTVLKSNTPTVCLWQFNIEINWENEKALKFTYHSSLEKAEQKYTDTGTHSNEDIYAEDNHVGTSGIFKWGDHCIHKWNCWPP